MRGLTAAVIRLAYGRPDLRPYLLPLLRGAGMNPVRRIDHGYDQPLAGGTDIMKRLQDQLLIEQGREPREPNPRLATDTE